MKINKNVTSSSLLSYVYFNPIFKASRNVRRKIRKYLGAKVRAPRTA